MDGGARVDGLRNQKAWAPDGSNGTAGTSYSGGTGGGSSMVIVRGTDL